MWNSDICNPGRSRGIIWTMQNTTRSQLRHSTELIDNIDYSGRTKPVVSEDYIVGLTDGEGCFYVNVSESSRYKTGSKVELHFHIKLNERDRGLLEKVKNTLDCGNVYFQNEKRKNHAQCYRYTVASHRDIIGTKIPFFKEYPLQSASKQLSFNLFSEIAVMVYSGKHLTKEGVAEIKKLKHKMNQKTTGLA